MYVCLCHAVTERQVIAAVSEGAGTLRELSATLGVATGCGQCAEHACDLIAAQTHRAVPARADEHAARVA